MSNPQQLPGRPSQRRLQITRSIAVGVVAGVAWSTGFRAFMTEIAGAASQFDWAGTFLGVILPGAITGALLGLAAGRVPNLEPSRQRWLALAPLTFAIIPLALPGALNQLVTQGLGGGAIAVALLALAGGYAAGGVGAIGLRIGCGVFAVAVVVALSVTPQLIAGERLEVTQPRGAWVSALIASHLAILALASAIPHRRFARATLQRLGFARRP